MPSFSYSAKQRLFSLIEAVPLLAKIANRWAINRVVNRSRPRPHPMSTAADYVCWQGLTDRRWSGRHLPPRPRIKNPDPEALLQLFQRRDGKQRLCPKST